MLEFIDLLERTVYPVLTKQIRSILRSISINIITKASGNQIKGRVTSAS